VNNEKGGIMVGSKRYGVRLVFVEDASNKEQVTNATANALRSAFGEADFAWGPYSSGMNQYAVRQSYADGTLQVNSGSSQSSVYAHNNLTFGVLPSSTTYLNPVFGMLKQAAAAQGVALSSLKVGCIGDNSGHMAQCAQVPDLAQAAGITIDADSYTNLYMTRVGNPPTDAEMNATLAKYKAAGINIIVSTGYNGTQWVMVQNLMKLDYTPLAAVCTISYIPTWPGEYLFHPSPWSATRPVRGQWSGLTSVEFAARFAAAYGGDASLTYQGAGAFGGAAALAAAIEAAGTLETQAVARQLYKVQPSPTPHAIHAHRSV
jgi:ABC-type branched-subunit amino acid transport system substrate-binding protein